VDGSVDVGGGCAKPGMGKQAGQCYARTIITTRLRLKFRYAGDDQQA
jgi:hypothetical protein